MNIPEVTSVTILEQRERAARAEAELAELKLHQAIYPKLYLPYSMCKLARDAYGPSLEEWLKKRYAWPCDDPRIQRLHKAAQRAMEDMSDVLVECSVDDAFEMAIRLIGCTMCGRNEETY